jgi:hypothetical protein
MQDSSHNKIIYSKYSKIIISILLIVSSISLIWDTLKFFHYNIGNYHRIIGEFLSILSLFILYQLIVKESSLLLKYFKNRDVTILLWIIGFLMAGYLFDYPYNLFAIGYGILVFLIKLFKDFKKQKNAGKSL